MNFDSKGTLVTSVDLHFGEHGVYLDSGEPLSEEEALAIRDALTRYVENELPYMTADSKDVYPASNAAYDRFITWAVQNSEPTEDGGWRCDLYEDHKNRRALRIRTQVERLSDAVDTTTTIKVASK